MTSPASGANQYGPVHLIPSRILKSITGYRSTIERVMTGKPNLTDSTIDWYRRNVSTCINQRRANRIRTNRTTESEHPMIRPHTCPVCSRDLPAQAATTLASFPFCSERCRSVDLFRWSQGRYAIVEDLEPHRLALEIEREQGIDE